MNAMRPLEPRWLARATSASNLQDGQAPEAVAARANTLVVPGDHAVPEWGDSPSASPPEQRAGSFNKKRGSKLAVNTSGSPYSPAPRAADASGSTGTNGISQPDSPKLSADSGSPSFSKERRRSQLSQWTGSGRVKRQSLSTMFDSTVQKGAGILSSPASRRRSFMPAALMKKEGSGLSKNSPPQPLPWHGSPTSLAAPDSVEGLRVKAKPSPEITRRQQPQPLSRFGRAACSELIRPKRRHRLVKRRARTTRERPRTIRTTRAARTYLRARRSQTQGSCNTAV